MCIRDRFRHHGGYYHATIDDVQLIDDEFRDIGVLTSFVGRNPASAIPLSQTNDIPLHVDITNEGNTAVSDVMIQAEARGPDGELEFTTVNSNFMEQPANCFLNENSTFTELFTPSQLGDYRVCLLYTSPSPRDRTRSRMPSSA